MLSADEEVRVHEEEEAEDKEAGTRSSEDQEARGCEEEGGVGGKRQDFRS